MASDENCARNSTLKFPATYGPELRKNSKCHIFLSFGRWPKQSNNLYCPMIRIPCIKFGWNLMKTVEGVVFRKFQTKRKELGIKGILHICTIWHWVPIFRPFRSMISRFRDIPQFRFFPLTPLLKFQSAKYFFKNVRLLRKEIAVFHHGSQCAHKVWPTSDKTCRSSILKFPGAYGPLLTKISKCHEIFNFWQIAKKVIAYISPSLSYLT